MKGQVRFTRDTWGQLSNTPLRTQRRKTQTPCMWTYEIFCFLTMFLRKQLFFWIVFIFCYSVRWDLFYKLDSTKREILRCRLKERWKWSEWSDWQRPANPLYRTTMWKGTGGITVTWRPCPVSQERSPFSSMLTLVTAQVLLGLLDLMKYQLEIYLAHKIKTWVMKRPVLCREHRSWWTNRRTDQNHAEEWTHAVHHYMVGQSFLPGWTNINLFGF